MLAILRRKPLQYRVIRQVGLHRLMASPNGYPELRFSFHDRATIAPGAVRKILTQDVGLSQKDALALVRGDL